MNSIHNIWQIRITNSYINNTLKTTKTWIIIKTSININNIIKTKINTII